MIDEPKPAEVKTAANCHRLGHVDVRVPSANLDKCVLCGRAVYREYPALGRFK